MTGEEGQFAGMLSADDGVAVVTVAGILSRSAAGRLQSLIDEAVGTGVAVVIVDMTDVALVDAGSVHVLVAAAERLRGRGAKLEVRGVSPRIYLRLQIAGVIEALAVQPPPASLVRDLMSHTSAPQARTVLDAALKLVVTMTEAVIVGAEGVSITLPRDGRLGTVAASNDVVLEMDHDQYDTGEGPCLDAAKEGHRFHIDSLRDEARWPAFVPRARARGIETILSAPLVSAQQPIGALNLYSRTVGAFVEHEKRWANQFAEEASAVVASALPDNSATIVSGDVHQALRSREVIAQAQGAIMYRDGLSPTAAYAVLRDASSRSGKPLRDICEGVLSGDEATDAIRGRGDGSVDERPSP